MIEGFVKSNGEADPKSNYDSNLEMEKSNL